MPQPAIVFHKVFQLNTWVIVEGVVTSLELKADEMKDLIIKQLKSALFGLVQTLLRILNAVGLLDTNLAMP